MVLELELEPLRLLVPDEVQVLLLVLLLAHVEELDMEQVLVVELVLLLELELVVVQKLVHELVSEPVLEL